MHFRCNLGLMLQLITSYCTYKLIFTVKIIQLKGIEICAEIKLKVAYRLTEFANAIKECEYQFLLLHF